MKISELDRLLRPVQKRIRLLIGRCVLDTIKADGKFQSAKVTGIRSQTLEGLEYFEQFGITAVPLEGAEGLVLNVSGNRDGAVVICLGDRNKRPTDLNPGETCLYDALGQEVRLKDDGTIAIYAENDLVIDAALSTFNGDVDINGDLSVDGDIDADDITASGNVTGSEVTVGTLALSNHVHGFTAPSGPVLGPIAPPPAP